MEIEWNGEMLTEKQTLFLCWKLWERLAKTGCALKTAWPHWREMGGKVKRMMGDCPCCEYVRQQEKRCHVACLLLTLWPERCLSESSPYQKWVTETSLRLRKKYARIIAKAAKKEYMKYEKGNNK